MADSIPPYPLYNSTYAAYRLSPLYHGSNPFLEETSLRMHARRLRDVLRGETLRGVDVGYSGTENGNIGSLESCTWDLLGNEESWETLHQQNSGQEEREEPGDLSDAPALSPDEARGVHVQLRYQKATHSALLLRDPDAASLPCPRGFTPLPLLLIRMPAALKETFTDYLASTFDTRAAPMKMRSSFLSSSLESLLSDLDTDSSAQSLPTLLKGLQIQLSFPGVFRSGAPPPLRSIDITLARDDIPEFLSRGTRLISANPSLLRPPPSQTQRQPLATTVTGPFTAALSHYLSAHLALPLSHPAVAISKIACAPLLALSGDGKLKIFAPPAPASASASADVSIASDEADVSTAHRAALHSFYTSLLAYATGAPLADGVVAPEPVLPRKGKEKQSGRAKGKRALGLGDANAKPARATEMSPKRRKKGRAGAVEAADGRYAAEAGVVGSRSQMSVPPSPPPPYELHDPAIVAGGR